MIRRRWPALLGFLACATAVHAQPKEPQDEAYDLATIQADHEICGFALSDEQQEVISQRRDGLATRGDLSDGEIAAVQGQVSAALTRQKTEGLCRPDGPEAQAYKRRLTALGLL